MAKSEFGAWVPADIPDSSRRRRLRTLGFVGVGAILVSALALVGGGVANGDSSRAATVTAGLVERARTQGSIEVIARLSGRADTSPAEYAELGAAVAATIADKSSVDLLAEVGAVSMTASAAEIQRLAASRSVVSIEPDLLLKPALSRSGPAVGANFTTADGFNGSGYAVAVVDSGVDSGHPAFGGRVVGEACFTRDSCAGTQAFAEGAGSGLPCTFSGCEHGTHVAGIVASGDSLNRGIAPATGVVSLQVFSKTTGAECGNEPQPCARARISDIARALAYAAQPNIRDTYRIVAANISIASDSTFDNGCDAVSPTLRDAIDRLWAAGIAATIAAGNSSNPNQLSLPACIERAVSVGATFVDRAEAWSVSNWSPGLDFAAPGVGITSTIKGGGFDVSSGTSSAAPHVAGAWAVAAQRLGTTDPTTIYQALQASSRSASSGSRVARPALYLRNLSLNGLPRSPGGLFADRWAGVPFEGVPVVGSFRRSGTQEIYLYSGPTSVISNRVNGAMSFSAFGSGGGFIPVPVDVNGDGLTDIYWYGNGRQNYLWFATGDSRVFREATLAETPAAGGGYTPIPIDLTGDGRTDIVWYGQGKGEYVWIAADGVAGGYIGRPLGEVFGAVAPKPAGYVPAAGDFDGDGKADLFWHGPGGLPDEIWYTSTAPRSSLRGAAQTVSRGALRSSGFFQVEGNYRLSIGDFDNDGRDDILWDAQGRPYGSALWLSRDTGFVDGALGYFGSATPVAGNFDSVRGDDVLWFGPGSANDTLWLANR